MSTETPKITETTQITGTEAPVEIADEALEDTQGGLLQFEIQDFKAGAPRPGGNKLGNFEIQD